jgi:hypothetical protein
MGADSNNGQAVAAQVVGDALAEAEAAVREDGRIPFADGNTQHLDPIWAAAMLRIWRRRQPAQFGAVLAEVVTGIPTAARRSRAAEAASRDGAQ